MRSTIDFGIDLGTTNSSIAVMQGMTPVIIKNNDGMDNTPSCVFIDKNKKLFTGRMAYQRVEADPDNAKSEFKRLMGQDSFYTFLDSGLKLRPEELAAEVLKYIKSSVKQRLGEDLQAAVITVPAGFKMPAIEATKRAAELAGFRSSALLQEPVAAATAYGFQREDERAFWLVYDMGGGTFDAAIIELREGQFWVMDHGGADFGMAGKDMDWAIVEKYFLPEILKAHPLDKFDRGNPAYRGAFAKLKMAAEKAKIELSNYDTTPVFVENLFTGSDFVFESELARAQVEAIAMPIISGSVEKCRQIIAEKNLDPKDFQKLILVGGPTLAPYLRESLADPKAGLGIPIDFSVDPFTVVAQGAAIFAKTQILESAFLPAVKGNVRLELKYDPIGSDPEPIIGGTATSPDVTNFNGFSVQFDREGWTSGKIPLKDNGVFITSLLAERGFENKFRLSIFDPQGNSINVAPDEITYIIGNAPGDQVMINSIGVALMNNQTDWFFRRGEQIPRTIRREYKTMLPVEKGKSGDFIRVPIVEGEEQKADYNLFIGELLISGENNPRNVPAGSDIEITIKIDKNRILETTAYLPILDMDFSKVIDLKTIKPDPGKLAEELEKENNRSRELHEEAKNARSAKALEILKKAEEKHPIDSIRSQVTASANEEDDSGRMAEESIRERRKANDQVKENIEWPTLVIEVREMMANMREMMEDIGRPEEKPAFEELCRNTEEAISKSDIAQLRYFMDELDSLRWQVITRDHGFWLYMFDKVSRDTNVRFENPERAQRLIQEGNSAILEKNIEKLKMIVSQLIALIPQNQVQEISRGFGSTLMN